MLFLFVVLAIGGLAVAGFDAEPSGAGTGRTEVVEGSSDPFGADLPDNGVAEDVIDTPSDTSSSLSPFPVDTTGPSRPQTARPAAGVAQRRAGDPRRAVSPTPAAPSSAVPPAPAPARSPAAAPVQPVAPPPSPSPSHGEPSLIDRLLGRG